MNPVFWNAKGLAQDGEFLKTLRTGIAVRCSIFSHRSGGRYPTRANFTVFGIHTDRTGAEQIFWFETTLSTNETPWVRFHLVEASGLQRQLERMPNHHEGDNSWWDHFAKADSFAGMIVLEKKFPESMNAASPYLSLYNGILLELVCSEADARKEETEADDSLIQESEAYDVLRRRLVGFMSKVQDKQMAEWFRRILGPARKTAPYL